MKPPVRTLALLLLLSPGTLVAQASERGVFQLRSGNRDVGSETFTVVADSGIRITSTSSWPSRIELTASMDRRDQGGAAFQLERKAGDASGQVYAVQKRNRITVRRVDRGAEQASELPAGPRTVLLADSVFALYLQIVPLATETGQTVNALFPVGTRRMTLTAHRANGAKGAIIRVSGGVEAEIELGNDDQVQRISLPALRLEAVRRPD